MRSGRFLNAVVGTRYEKEYAGFKVRTHVTAHIHHTTYTVVPPLAWTIPVSHSPTADKQLSLYCQHLHRPQFYSFLVKRLSVYNYKEYLYIFQLF